jgi:hypothetical protein
MPQVRMNMAKQLAKKEDLHKDPECGSLTRQSSNGKSASLTRANAKGFMGLNKGTAISVPQNKYLQAAN